MARDDPYDADPPYTYECTDCGARVEADDRPGECSDCGGEMRNISTPSER